MFILGAAFLPTLLIFVDGFIISKGTESDRASTTNVLSAKDSVFAVNGKLKVGKISNCLGCLVAIPALRAMLRANLSFNAVSIIIIAACEAFHIEQPDVCTGAANEYADEVLTVLKNVTLSDAEVCSFIVGCPSDFDDRFKWLLHFPDVPKPPVVPVLPPVPGAPKLRALHVSDIHVDFHYRPGSNAVCDRPLCCQDDSDLDSAGKWGDYNCDVPPWTVENLFQHLSTNEKPFDYILWTGDQTSHRVWNNSRADDLRTLDYITQLFIKYFPSVPVFPAVGNHESVPVNSFPPDYIRGNRSMNWLYDALAQSWTRWLPKDSLRTVKSGGYYTAVLKPGFRIVSLNTNYCNNQNLWLMFNITDPMDQLTWFISILDNAEKTSEKVHVIAHIPPGSENCLKWWSWNYYAIINRYESVIAGQFFGHVHVDSLNLFYDVSDGLKRPVSVAYVGPSVTPLQHLNMGYRVYEVDGFYANSSWAVLDHETSILNITEANLMDRPQWVKEYTAKETYNMTSLTAAEWDRVLRRMKTDDDVFNRYYRLYFKQHPVDRCNETCRKNMLCEIKSGRSHDLHLCDDLHDELLSDERRRSFYESYIRWSNEKRVC